MSARIPPVVVEMSPLLAETLVRAEWLAQREGLSRVFKARWRKLTILARAALAEHERAHPPSKRVRNLDDRCLAVDVGGGHCKRLRGHETSKVARSFAARHLTRNGVVF